jgi:hypothetical protein
MEFVERFFSALVSPLDIRDYRVNLNRQEFPKTFILPTVSVKNQGSIGSCVAHACSSVVEFHNKRQEGTDIIFSTDFIYGYRPVGYYVGEGMYIRDALSTLRKVGDCPRNILVGNTTYSRAMEKVEADLEKYKDAAYPHRISTYAKIKKIDEIKQALMDFGYVVVSMPWHKDSTLVDGIYTFTSKKNRGYHCVVIYGWDERGWLVQNSWGQFWGQEGRFIVPFDFKWKEAWAVTDKIIGENDVIRPADSWFVKTFAPIINKLANTFWKLINKLIRKN